MQKADHGAVGVDVEVTQGSGSRRSRRVPSMQSRRGETSVEDRQEGHKELIQFPPKMVEN